MDKTAKDTESKRGRAGAKKDLRLPPCDEFIEDIVREVTEDFEVRRNERKNIELGWQLNMNFVMGNQYCRITGRGEIEDSEKHYFWQEREVYNHIAPIVETRLAKLGRVRPKMSVRASSSATRIYIPRKCHPLY